MRFRLDATRAVLSFLDDLLEQGVDGAVAPRAAAEPRGSRARRLAVLPTDVVNAADRGPVSE